jgi:hypothetical protein
LWFQIAVVIPSTTSILLWACISGAVGIEAILVGQTRRAANTPSAAPGQLSVEECGVSPDVETL